MNETQYKILCERRNQQDNLIWQTPSLAVAALAFLMATALNPQTDAVASLVLSVFSFVVGLAAIQLMAKHRYLEMADSELLAKFECEHQGEGFAILHGRRPPVEGIARNWLVRIRSFRLWIFVLAGFCAVASYGAFSAMVRLH